MTKSAIDTAQAWQKRAEKKTRQITIHYTGASGKEFRSWLGDNLDYQEQPAGDLGRRMGYAFETTLNSGSHHAIGIGTDTPTLSAALLHQADKNLNDYDLVLGPAADGGYYLIGMKKFQPELFTNIDWGTEYVLRQTLEIASRLKLQVATLPQLNDIDRPEDLHFIRDDSRFNNIISGTPSEN